MCGGPILPLSSSPPLPSWATLHSTQPTQPTLQLQFQHAGSTAAHPLISRARRAPKKHSASLLGRAGATQRLPLYHLRFSERHSRPPSLASPSISRFGQFCFPDPRSLHQLETEAIFFLSRLRWTGEAAWPLPVRRVSLLIRCPGGCP